MAAAVTSGGEDYDAALPGAPTELAPSADETTAHTAWALDDGPEWRPPFWTPARITTAAVISAVAAVVAVAGLVGYHLRPASESAASSTTTTSAPPVTSTPPPPPATVTVTTAAPTTAQTVAALDPPMWTVEHDRRFIALLQANGWTIWNQAAMADNGHFVCTWLQNGDSPAQVQSRLTDISRAEAWSIIRAAIAAYPNCP